MKIAIITGGSSGEREVSLRSAKNIAHIIDQFAETQTWVFPEQERDFFNAQKPDLVVPVIHGEGGEDGTLQKKLEGAGIRYLFSGFKAHALGIDKRATKKRAAGISIPIAREFTRHAAEYPLFAKPLRGGSTVNAGLIHNEAELEERFAIESELVLEEYVQGREFTVGVIESSGETIALPVIEIIAKGGVFDYDSKYNPEKLATELCPAPIESELAEQLQQYALAIHKDLGVRHMSRSDFLVDPSDRIVFLEINTIPGFTSTSLVPKALQVRGISDIELFKEWCGGQE